MMGTSCIILSMFLLENVLVTSANLMQLEVFWDSDRWVVIVAI